MELVPSLFCIGFKHTIQTVHTQCINSLIFTACVHLVASHTDNVTALSFTVHVLCAEYTEQPRGLA
jgi:hypothetical protein